MPKGLIAKGAITIAAPPAKVWSALVTPADIKQYMFGSTVASDWKEGSVITFTGEWQGRAYEDHGRILRAAPGRTLQYTHFSPLAGLPDKPENYHTVTIELASEGVGTRITLSQDNNKTPEEQSHSEKNWAMMLEGLKRHVEK